MKLITTIKNLITETVSFDDLQRAVKNRDVIIITYDGDEPGGKGYRTVYPVCLGRSLRDNLVLRAYEPEGASHSVAIGEKQLPGWRLFRIDKTFTFNRTGETFNTLPSDYNPNGDKLMKTVYINTVLPVSGQEETIEEI
jgi:predicted DNA-binding transcriptional regulator YafY